MQQPHTESNFGVFVILYNPHSPLSSPGSELLLTLEVDVEDGGPMMSFRSRSRECLDESRSSLPLSCLKNRYVRIIPLPFLR